MYQSTISLVRARLSLYIILAFLAVCGFGVSTKFPQGDPWIKILEIVAGTIIVVVVGGLIDFVFHYFFNSHAKEVKERVNITTTWQKLGVLQMSPNWRSFLNTSEEGTEFRDHLGYLSEDATWYIVTMNPEGFLSSDFFRDVIYPALQNSNFRLKWLYVRLPEKDDPAGKTLRDWWALQYAMDENDIDRKLHFSKANLDENLSRLRREIEQISKAGSSPPSIEIYESQIPVPFLALLAVKNKKPMKLSKKKSGVALVHPYTVAPTRLLAQNQWGITLVKPGELYEQYSSAIIHLFDNEESQGYLHRILPEVQN